MKEMTDEELEQEERWSLGCAIGEGAWVKMCMASGADPKDPDLHHSRSAVVSAVRGAFIAMEGAGLNGLAQWLDMEDWVGMEVGE